MYIVVLSMVDSQNKKVKKNVFVLILIKDNK